MKLATIGAAVLSLSIGGWAHAQAEEGANPATAVRNTGTPSGSRLLPNGQNADAVQKGKASASTAKSSTGKRAARKAPPVKDTATATAPHRYPPTARGVTGTVGAIRSDNAGTVHKNAPTDQVAGTGG